MKHFIVTLILLTILCTLGACHKTTQNNTPTSVATVTQAAPEITETTITPATTLKATATATPTPSPLLAYSGLLPQEKETIGVNLEGLADWSSGLCFVDAMLTARTFGTPKACWQEGTIALDDSGWPLEDADVVIHADVTESDISGTYQLSFEGTADVEPYFGVKVANMRQNDGRTYAEIIVPEAPHLL